MTVTIIIILLFIKYRSKGDHNVTKYLDSMVFIFNLKEIMDGNIDIT